MDAFEFDNVKVEKANAMKQYHRVLKLGNIFRFFELCGALVLVFWFFLQLPVALRISTDYFKSFCHLVIRPYFVFVIGNAIIITLFVKSGQFSGTRDTGNSSGTDLYGEFVKNSEIRYKNRTDSGICKDGENRTVREDFTDTSPSPTVSEELIVYEDKQIVHTVSDAHLKTTVAPATEVKIDTCTDKKVYRRSQSENVKKKKMEIAVSEEKPKRKLQRSKTENCGGKVTEKKMEKVTSAEEEMSNEELRRKVEAFIEKQVKFHRQESMAIVLQNKW